MWNRLFPFLQWLPSWPKSGHVSADFWAGLTGATVVLPQGVAFATLAGMPPEYGLYAAMVPCIVAALWGASRAMVTGPANAISLTTLALVSPLAIPESSEYVALVLALTFLVGLSQLLIGVTGLGRWVEKVPHSVILGFTIGASVLIANSQVGTALGLQFKKSTAIADTFTQLAEQFHMADWMALCGALSTIVFILLYERFSKRIPSMFLGLLTGAALVNLLVYAIDHPGVKTVSALPSALPIPSWPIPSWHQLPDLVIPTVVMTMLALAEASAIARAIASRQGVPFQGTQEVIGQGLANLFGSFFSSYPASGSFNRSGVNLSSGAKSAMAAVFASVLLVAMLLFARDLVVWLPLPCIAGLLWLVAWRLIDLKDLRKTLRQGSANSISCLFTMFATILWSLEGALIGGVVLYLGVIHLSRLWRRLR
jgi:SulP family sulfate permease